MRHLRVLRARLFALFYPSRVETEMEEELRFHLAMRRDDNVRCGMTEPEAAREARRQFGNVNLIKDAWRDVVGSGALEPLRQDVRDAVRTLVKDRAFTLIAVLALALGIGANTALFTVVSNVLLRPLPFPDAEQIMSISFQEDGKREKIFRFSYPDFTDLQASNRWFARLGAFTPRSFVVAGGEGDAIHAQGARVTPEILRLLGIEPTIGRLFAESDSAPGNRRALVSYELWQVRFGGAASAIGSTILLDGYSYEVIGVMPPGFQLPVANEPAQVWTTFARDFEGSSSGETPRGLRRDAHYLNLLGRLKENVTAEQAALGVQQFAARQAAHYPLTNRRFDSCAVVPWLVEITGKVRPALLLLFAGAVCVLTVACVNVANLLLGRAITRQKEMAIRAALGAGRRRIVRQLVAESLVLAALGGCVGLVLAVVGTHYIVAMLPPDFPRSRDIAPGIEAFVFTALTTVVTSCVFGFAPAWHCTRSPLASAINDCSRVSGENRRARRFRDSLVMTELVLSFVLVAAALLLIRGFLKLQNAGLGFNPHNLITANLSLPENGSDGDPQRTPRFYRELLKRLATVKEIDSASAVYPLPFTAQWLTDFEISGRSIPKADLPRARPYVVTPKFFETMQIPLIAGRDFDERDDRTGSPVVIVNQALVQTIFPNNDPLGKRIRPGVTDESGPIPDREIVGVVGDIKADHTATNVLPAVYLPHAQCAAEDMTLVMRGAGSTNEMLRATREVISRIDPQVPAYESHAMKHYLSAAVAQARLNSLLTVIFAGVAVLLTAIGVYGVTAYHVTQRTHEIGIRLALGAQKASILRLVLGKGARLIAWSLLIGSVCTVAAKPLLHPVIHGSGSETIAIFVMVSALVGIVALAACWFPAQRAARFDPLRAIGQR